MTADTYDPDNGLPEKAPAPLIGGAIGRSVEDAHAAYRARLARAVADLQEASVQG